MSTMTLSNVRTQFQQLYQAQSYAQALELVKEALLQFPDDWRLYNWRMCLEARLDEPTQALQTLREALERGMWSDPTMLRDDEDLQSLQGLAEYEQLVAECQRQFAAAQETMQPDLLTLQPQQKPTQFAPLAIALHGNTGNARANAQEWQWLTTQGWRVALPQSSQLIAPNAAVWNDYAKGTREVQSHYARLHEQYGIDSERMIVGGFSAGGGLAIHLAVTGAIKARGFVVVGPYLRDPDVLIPFLETARANGVRGYLIMGLQEPPEGQELMRKVADLLNKHGVWCLVEQRPDLAHVFPPDFDLSLAKALKFFFPDEKV